MEAGIWHEFMSFVHSSAEIQGTMYACFGMLAAIPAALVGKLFRLIPGLPNDKIPLVMGGVLLSSCWFVSYYVPMIDRANLITAAGLGGLLSGQAHDTMVQPIERNIPTMKRRMMEAAGLRKPKDE